MANLGDQRKHGQIDFSIRRKGVSVIVGAGGVAILLGDGGSDAFVASFVRLCNNICINACACRATNHCCKFKVSMQHKLHQYP